MGGEGTGGVRRGLKRDMGRVGRQDMEKTCGEVASPHCAEGGDVKAATSKTGRQMDRGWVEREG